MKNSIVAVTAIAAFTVPSLASAQTTLFGQFKYEIGVVENLEGDRGAVHSNIGTRIGIRAAEDLGGGLQAIARFQGNFNSVNQSLSGQSFDLNEENWVGLQGRFGRVLVGRSNTALKAAHLPFRGFGDTLADLNNRPASFGRAEGIHYVTPNFGGLTVSATLEPNGNELDSYYSVAAIYKQGPLFASIAVEDAPDTGIYQGGGKAIVPDGTNLQVGVRYTWEALTIGILYQDIDDIAEWVTIPVTFALTPAVTLRAAAQYRDPDANGEDDGTNFALGVQYDFSGRTEIFANVWRDDFETVTPNGGVGGGSADKTHFGVGLRHSF